VGRLLPEIDEPRSLNVAQPSFQSGESAHCQPSVNDMKTLSPVASVRQPRHGELGLRKRSFRFYGTVMTVARKLQPRWKRALNSVNDRLGDPRYPVCEKWQPAGEDRALELLNNLKEAFRDASRPGSG
jgi:predicted metalloendopeptidase